MALQNELAELRRDKMQVEEQLKDALEVPIALPPTIQEKDEGNFTEFDVKVSILDVQRKSKK